MSRSSDQEARVAGVTAQPRDEPILGALEPRPPHAGVSILALSVLACMFQPPFVRPTGPLFVASGSIHDSPSASDTTKPSNRLVLGGRVGILRAVGYSSTGQRHLISSRVTIEMP